jgi:Mg/Co/Ni transporter MgtE
MIVWGSNSFCQLVGKNRFHFLLGFLPITMATSGIVCQQASAMTKGFILTASVSSQSFGSWVLHECVAALYLAVGTSTVVGLIAFLASGSDLVFAIALTVQQFFAIAIAGFIGSLAPLLYSFALKCDSRKWGDVIETTLQDIVGCFSAAITWYFLVRVLGAAEVNPEDTC